MIFFCVLFAIIIVLLLLIFFIYLKLKKGLNNLGFNNIKSLKDMIKQSEYEAKYRKKIFQECRIYYFRK